MKIEHIVTFLEIASSGSFIRAAEHLNVTQSTVSARVKTLEESFGQVLFARSHTGVELTPAGLRFRRYASNIQRMWQQANQEIALPEGFQAVLGLVCGSNGRPLYYPLYSGPLALLREGSGRLDYR